MADAIAELDQRREDAWKVMKQMHDQANGVFELTAAQGWCAPSSAIYSQVPIMVEYPDLTEELTKVPEWYR